MSDQPTLYRIAYHISDVSLLEAQALERQGVLVPVEPCEHGNTGRHAVIELQEIDGGTGVSLRDWRYVGECSGEPA